MEFPVILNIFEILLNFKIFYGLAMNVVCIIMSALEINGPLAVISLNVEMLQENFRLLFYLFFLLKQFILLYILRKMLFHTLISPQPKPALSHS